MNLKVYLTLKNHHYKDLEKCILSIKPLNAHVLIFSDGNKNDETINQFPFCDIVYKDESEFTQSLNDNINTNAECWNLYLKPNEEILHPQKILGAIETTELAYNLLVYNSGVVNKELRLWYGKLNFENVIYPSIAYQNAKNLDCMLQSRFVLNEDKTKLDNLLSEWVNQEPTSARPYYYLAFRNLEENNYKQFLNCANEYLNRDNSTCMSTIMLKYYVASVGCYQEDHKFLASFHILGCLAVKPLMAEFWCLLGDIYYNLEEDYNKAKEAYENAKILGSKRDMNDGWPIVLEAYKDLPDKMIANCNNIQKNYTMFYMND